MSISISIVCTYYTQWCNASVHYTMPMCTRCTYSTRAFTSHLLHNNITDRSNWIISIPLLMYILLKWMQTHEFLLQYRLKSIAISVCVCVNGTVNDGREQVCESGHRTQNDACFARKLFIEKLAIVFSMLIIRSICLFTLCSVYILAESICKCH